MKNCVIQTSVIYKDALQRLNSMRKLRLLGSNHTHLIFYIVVLERVFKLFHFIASYLYFPDVNENKFNKIVNMSGEIASQHVLWHIFELSDGKRVSDPQWCATHSRGKRVPSVFYALQYCKNPGHGSCFTWTMWCINSWWTSNVTWNGLNIYDLTGYHSCLR